MALTARQRLQPLENRFQGAPENSAPAADHVAAATSPRPGEVVVFAPAKAKRKPAKKAGRASAPVVG